MKALLCILAVSLPLYAAISPKTTWEVRATGNDTNGGGFVTGATGTDYSQNDNANAAACSNCGSATVDLSTTDAVTANSTTVTSATCNCGTTLIGNLIYLVGTGTTTGWYEVKNVVAASPPAAVLTVDRATGSTGGTGVTMNIGGALATLGQLNANMAKGNQAYVKSGTYTRTTTITVTLSCLANSSGAEQDVCYINGYGATRNDGGARPLITTATDSTDIYSLNGSSGMVWNHLSFSSTATTRADAFHTASGQAYYTGILDCVFDGLAQAIRADTNAINPLIIQNSEIKNSTTAATGAVVNKGTTALLGDYIHNNTAHGFQPTLSTTAGAVTAVGSVFASNGGAGIEIASGDEATPEWLIFISGNVFYKNGTSGFFQGDGSQPVMLENNVFDQNTRYGWEIPSAGTGVNPPYASVNRNNAYYLNGMGQRLNAPAGANDVTLSADPFTAPAGPDFTLNSTSGGGAACKAVGYPGVTLFGTGYLDIGALQSQAGAGPATTHSCASAQ